MADVRYEIIETSSASNVVIREFIGIVKADDVIESFKYIFEKYVDEEFTAIITDFTHAKFAMSISDFQKVLKYIKKTPVIFDIQLAIIVDTPKKVIFPILAKTKLKKLNIKPFSTVDAAIKWLN